MGIVKRILLVLVLLSVLSCIGYTKVQMSSDNLVVSEVSYYTRGGNHASERVFIVIISSTPSGNSVRLTYDELPEWAVVGNSVEVTGGSDD